MDLLEFDLTAYFIYFHHLKESSREKFQWITFGRINSVSTLRIDQQMLDNLFLDTIADIWGSCLTDMHIEVQECCEEKYWTTSNLGKFRLFRQNSSVKKLILRLVN